VLEPEVALLDEVEQVHALGQGVAAGDGDHEAQVGADEAVLGLRGRAHVGAQLRAALAGLDGLGGVAPALDGLGQVALVLCGEQGDLADFVEVDANCVSHVLRNHFVMGNVPAAVAAVGTAGWRSISGGWWAVLLGGKGWVVDITSSVEICEGLRGIFLGAR
jgi:hypothetical protein